jgi:hypothetical protein
MESNKLTISFIIIIALFLTIVGLDHLDFENIESTSIISVLGLLISSFAFLVGGYLAVLAVSAYSHIRELDRAHNKINSQKLEIELIGDSTRQMALESAEILDHIYTHYSESFDRSTQNTENIEKYNSIMRRRSLFWAKNDFLSLKRRKGRIMELAETGKYRDIKLLKSVKEYSTTDDELKTIIESVIEKLKSRRREH